MKLNRLFNLCLICTPIVIAGLGFTSALPWISNPQVLASHSEVTTQSHAPEATRYYVAKTGDGTTGLDWPHAFTDLKDALGVVKSGDEIWVAAGVYTPGADPSDSYNLVPGVAVYGGFDVGDNQFSERDWESNITVLSGDIDGDDTTDENNVVTMWTNIFGDNSYHVVTADGTTGSPVSSSTVLDGFTITAGQADGTNEPNHRGGGFYCNGSGSGNKCSPSLRNLTFSGNSAVEGGAMFNNGEDGESSPLLINVTSSSNLAVNYGGAMYNNGRNQGTSSPSLSNVNFTGNSAGTSGGAMFNMGILKGISNPILENVTFTGNNAPNGGGMFNSGFKGISSPNLTNVIFSGNRASFGGGMFNTGEQQGISSPNLTNVTFSGNSVSSYGGAIVNAGTDGTCSPTVRNSILWNNQVGSSTGTITDTIHNFSASNVINHSLVEGTGGSDNWISDVSFVNGGGNIDLDPKFITPVDPSTAPTTYGDLRLKSNSPAIDKGDNMYITGVLTDLDGVPRIVDGDNNGTLTVDMGAYEYIEYKYDGYLPLIIR